MPPSATVRWRRASRSTRSGRSRCRTTGSSDRPSASRSTRATTSGSSTATRRTPSAPSTRLARRRIHRSPSAARRRRRSSSSTRTATSSATGADRARPASTSGRPRTTASSSTTWTTCGSAATAAATPMRSSSPATASSSCRWGRRTPARTKTPAKTNRASCATATTWRTSAASRSSPVDPEANEVYVADGYFNRRVVVIDADTGEFKRYWGAYGEAPDDELDLGPYVPGDPPATQFRGPIHCADISADGLLYVCDRAADRLQVFQPDGNVRPGSVHRSRDPGPGLDLGRGLLARRRAEVPLPRRRPEHEGPRDRPREHGGPSTPSATAAASPASSSPSTASPRTPRGNIYTTETYEGKRLQKFVNLGMRPVPEEDLGTPWPSDYPGSR